MTIFLYALHSRPDQRQIAAQIADAIGSPIDTVILENGADLDTAELPDRPGGSALLANICKGDLVMTWWADVLGGTPPKALRASNEILDRGASIRTLIFGFCMSPDEATSSIDLQRVELSRLFGVMNAIRSSRLDLFSKVA